MRKLTLNAILTVHLDSQAKQAKILIRDGDNVWVLGPMNVRRLTDNEKQNHDDEPDKP